MFDYHLQVIHMIVIRKEMLKSLETPPGQCLLNQSLVIKNALISVMVIENCLSMDSLQCAYKKSPINEIN